MNKNANIYKIYKSQRLSELTLLKDNQKLTS
jgi:hypothetical protein